MQSIHILAVGEIKEPWMRDACTEYQKRLGAFYKLQITEIGESRLPGSPSPAQISQCLQKEAAEIRKKLPARAFTVALCIEGERLSSPAFAEALSRAANKEPAIAFIIGSSHGLDEAIEKEADLRLSFSPMTFPHQLARVLLLEQLYRAGMILSGGKYHK